MNVWNDVESTSNSQAVALTRQLLDPPLLCGVNHKGNIRMNLAELAHSVEAFLVLLASVPLGVSKRGEYDMQTETATAKKQKTRSSARPVPTRSDSASVASKSQS